MFYLNAHLNSGFAQHGPMSASDCTKLAKSLATSHGLKVSDAGGGCIFYTGPDGISIVSHTTVPHALTH